jgi:hypothetical protein
VAIGIAEPGRDDRHAGPNGLEERVGGRGPRSVVGDLEEVDHWQPTADQLGVDALLDVAREQEAMAAELSEQHDRDVVDGRAAIGRPLGYAAWVRPEHTEPDVVERQAISGGEGSMGQTALREVRNPRRVPGSRADHPWLEDPGDAVPAQQHGEPGHMVLVGVCQHEGVDPVIPRRKPLVEGDEETPGIGPAVDEHPATVAALDEDGIALADVEHDDLGRPIRTVRHRERKRDRGRGKGEASDPRAAATRCGSMVAA